MYAAFGIMYFIWEYVTHQLFSLLCCTDNADAVIGFSQPERRFDRLESNFSRQNTKGTGASEDLP